MTTRTDDAADRAGPGQRRARVAALAAGPFFLGSILLNSWASIDFLGEHGWALRGSRDVLWPSILARRPYGAVQIATFAITGVLVLVMAHGLRPALPRRWAARGGGWLVPAFGLAVLASATPLDAPMADGGQPDTSHGQVHAAAFLVAVASAVLGALAFGPGLRGFATWRPLAVVSPVAAGAMVGSLVRSQMGLDWVPDPGTARPSGLRRLPPSSLPGSRPSATASTGIPPESDPEGWGAPGRSTSAHQGIVHRVASVALGP